jgi:hypothetical protein
MFMFYECPNNVYILMVIMYFVLFKNTFIWYCSEIYTSDKDLSTHVRGQAKDLTNALRTVVSDVVYMYE